jgi:adenine-specific DNA-methyltransferase
MKQIFGLTFEDVPEECVKLLNQNYPILKQINNKHVITDKKLKNNYLLIGENYFSLNVLRFTHYKSFDLIYIDPPYNRPGTKFKYNNNFVDDNDTWKHSKWLSFINHRLSLVKDLLKDDGVFICAIDEKEQEALGLLLQRIFPNHKIEIIVDQHNKRGKQGGGFSFCHEYHYFVYPDNNKKYIFPYEVSIEDQKAKHARQWGRESDRDDPNVPGRSMFYPIYVKNGKVIKAGEPLKENEPEPKPNENAEDEMIKVWPIDQNNIPKKWSFGRKSVDEKIKKKLLIVEKNKKTNLLEIKHYRETARVKTIWSDKKFDANVNGTKLLTEILGKNAENMYPKSLYTVEECLKITLKNKKNAKILDFFAGSGTTGHAVLNLNMQDQGERTFVLCTNNEEGENIAEEVCYPRLKNIIQGYAYNGVKKQILFDKEIEFEDFEKSKELLDEISKIESKNQDNFDYIKKYVEDEKIYVVGEKKIKSKTDGYKANLKCFEVIKDLFIPKDDSNLKDIFKSLVDIILLKEETFEEIKKDAKFSVFGNLESRITIIIYDHLEVQLIVDKFLRKNLPISVYIFQYEDFDFSEDFRESKYANVNLYGMPLLFTKIFSRCF